MVLNNRELSLLTWIGVLVIWIITKADTRMSLFRVFKSAFVSTLSAIYLVMAVYTAGVIFLLKEFNLWNMGQLKNTLFWFITVGLMALNDIVSDREGNYLKKTVKDIFGVTALVQFILGVYSFSYIVELLLLPFVTLLFATLAVAERDPKYHDAKNFLSNLLSLFGFFLIIYTIYKIISDFGSFANSGTLGDFLTPAALSILFLPLVYTLSIYIVHDDVFTGIKRILKKPALIRYAKIQTLIHFNINKKDLKRWRTLQYLRSAKSKKDIRKSITLIKKQKRLQSDPPTVDPGNGWSPYKAKDFLMPAGIVIEYYNPTYNNEWSGASNFLKLGLSNTISYYVEGDDRYATKLSLVLKIFTSDQSTTAHEKFLSIADSLYQKAILKKLPESLRPLILSGGDKKANTGTLTIVLKKEIFDSEKPDKYCYSLIISIIAK